MDSGFGTIAVKMKILHTGSKRGDAICLVDKDGAVIQFLHYGGEIGKQGFVAKDGPAKGLKGGEITVEVICYFLFFFFL